jgi:acetyl-CoA carboxylase biotin carboxyl carrier protein
MDGPGMNEERNENPTAENGEESKPQDLQRLKVLIDFLKENGVEAFSSETAERKVSIKFAGAAPAALDAAALAAMLGAGRASAPTGPAAASSAASSSAPGTQEPAAPADEHAGLHIVTSPIVGTFYESSAPGSPAFVNIGDQVELGQIVCIVEAMKLMNEIESDAAGEIVKRFVKNGQPIEYGQRLFAVRQRS